MSPLTAFPSPQGEKSEGIREQQPTAASMSDAEHSGPSAEAAIVPQESSDPSHGGPGPSTEEETITPSIDPAKASLGADEPEDISDGMEHFQRLRRRLLVSTLLASSAAVPRSEEHTSGTPVTL